MRENQRHTPNPGRRRQHRPADIALSLAENVNEALAVERQGQRAPLIGIVEGRRLAVDQQISTGIGRDQITNSLRRLLFHVLEERDCDLVGKGQVELTGDEGEDRGRAVRNDRVFDAVEIGPPRFPIIGISDQLDPFIRLELDEFERAGADRMLPNVAWRDMTRIDRRVA